MAHQPDCQWQRTTTAECDYRTTHHYCPHPEHACTCTRPSPKQHHPAVQHLLSLFDYAHLPLTLQQISAPIHDIAHTMANSLESGPELSVGLRHLLDGKDALVRQRVIDLRAANEPPPINSPEPFLTRPDQ